MARSILYSVLFLKCPRCRQGNLLESNPYKISNFNKVKDRCPKCDLKYAIEPSFFYGSMYVSYAVGVAFAVATYVIMLLLGIADDPLWIFVAIVGVLTITFPYIGAVSKSIWAHMFINYDTEVAEQVKSKSS
jgi:uncharacterized protein (DUF983 family)